MTTLYPTRYGTRLVTIDELFAEHHVDKMHPGFAPHLRAWLIAQNGLVGIGGSWRDTGSQPDKPGFAPEGKSFHQYQRFASGLVKFCAVDLVCRNGPGVHRAPHWDEVPEQGSAAAKRWRVHCNISSESWHMQPVIDHIPGYDGLDGWQGWINRGSPDPLVPDTPTPPEVQPPPIEQEDDMARINGFFVEFEGFADQWLCIPQTGDSKSRLEPDAPGPLVAKADPAKLTELAGYPLTRR